VNDDVPVSVEAQREEKLEKPHANVRAQAVQVRSKLGSKLYELIERDVDGFYELVRDAAFGDSDEVPKESGGKVNRGYAMYVTQHRKMFMDLMKIANADVDIGKADYQGDIALFVEQLRGMDKDELKALVRLGESSGGD
jgi:hypothetical protein